MARVDLKGLHWTKAKLADGRTATYWYAWRGGPRLTGEYGSPEFHESYRKACSEHLDQRRATAPRDMNWLTDRYEDSPEYKSAAEKTRKDYARHLATIRAEFGALTVAEIEVRGSRSLFLEWRDEIATKRGTRTGDYAFAVLARVLSWAADREYLARNPCEKAGRLHTGNRKNMVWSLDEEAAFLAQASAPMRLMLLLALWTAQREGDLLRLTWKAYDGRSLTLRQGKGGVRIRVPVAAPLKAVLDATKRAGVQIVVNRSGLPYTADGFRASFRKACEAASVTGRTFHDLRGTFSTRAGEAGATDIEIAAVTCHEGGMGDRRSALHTNYLSLTYQMAESCVAKLEQWHEARTPRQNAPQNGMEGRGG